MKRFLRVLFLRGAFLRLFGGRAKHVILLTAVRKLWYNNKYGKR